MSIIVQQDATIYSFIIFLQTALHVSDTTLIHQQEHTQTVITTSGTGPTVFATIRYQRTVTNKVRPVPDVVITV
jgi:shikimate kinase